MAIDPVCQMEINEASASSSAEHNGATYYFCSEGCAARFQKNPETYLKS